ncbi:hypothetical protein U9M48_020648 [Paspalum notatum var. saurae]|uniref:Cytochrome P450 n=1 Tax=Paspalum notatum var. saurae TaxID=547442 RepID=A0AAQ3TFX4_PASNO
MAVLLPWLAWPAWLLVSLLAVYLLDLYAHTRRGLPPGPRPLPFIGSLHLLGDQPHRSLARLAKIHGPLMSLRLGSVTNVVISSPEVAYEFLQKHDVVFAHRSVAHALGDHAKTSVAWLPPYTPWRTLRKIMATELFASHRLDALQHLRRQKVEELVGHVRRMAALQQGTPVDVGRVAFTTSLNLLSRTIFSCDLTNLDDHAGSKEFQELVAAVMEAAGSPNLSDVFPALAWADLQGMRRRLAQMFARLHQLFDLQVDRRLRERDAGEPRKNDFLDVLLDADVGLDRDTLRTFFTDLFVAGSDTTSNTVEWAMTELLRNPVSMAKTCNELVRVIGLRRNIEESDIHQLPYLRAVIKETFRLHPTVPLLLPRQAEATIQIMGHIIPKGARVLVNVWAMGQDKQIWTEPEMFMPERFLETPIDFKGGDFKLIPFGAGRRICPGMPLASRMVHLVLASLLNQFKWRLPTEVERNGIDMAENFGVSLSKATPLCAIATPI